MRTSEGARPYTRSDDLGAGRLEPRQQRVHLVAGSAAGAHGDLAQPEAGLDRLGDQVNAVEQEQAGGIAARDGAVSSDERVLAAGDRPHRSKHSTVVP
jgi:hypothetical protein